jgi:type IV secretory pathway VirB10-like protein
MEYAKIVAVTGLPGLFELVSSKSDGAIVKSLEDNSTKFVSSRIHNFSHLESIEVYTVRDNVNLVDIFTAMDKSGEKAPDEKDNAAVKKYFEKVYPDLDFDRVYSSDMKKMVKWFGVLKSNDIEIKLREVTEEEPVAEETPAVAEKAPAKEEKPKATKATKEAKETVEDEPAKKETKAKAPAKKEKEEVAEEKKEAAPKKKAAPKAKKEEGDDATEAPAKKKAAPKKDTKK